MNNEILFSYDRVEELVREFSINLPRELIRHPVTSSYVSKIERLGLSEALASNFTIAFIGQMRSGKSTLLNAIIGQNLAPVDINETTATINWFRYGSKADSRKFRVFWHDGSFSDHPLPEIQKWIGRQDNIKKTKWIDFFSDSELLKGSNINIVDTPGTRSTIEEHQDTTMGFLSQQLEEQTLKHGGSADAIVYVINPNIRADDKDILDMFGTRTRLPGASAYNSIATIQKWEHFEGRAWEKIAERSKKLERELEGKVACVVPTSGLLYTVLNSTSEDTWQELLDYTNGHQQQEIEDDILTEKDFPVESLKNNINWLVMRLCCRFAKHNGYTKAEDLINGLLEISGIDRLKQMLIKHFISKAKIIKLGSVVKKANDIGLEMKLRIEGEIRQQMALRTEGEEALRAVGSAVKPSQVGDYIGKTLVKVDSDIDLLNKMLRKTADIVSDTKYYFEFFENDIRCLRLLSIEEEDYDRDDKSMLQSLFGIVGSALKKRLDCTDECARKDLLEQTYSLLERYSGKKHMYVSDVYKHACDICTKIIQVIEGTNHEI